MPYVARNKNGAVIAVFRTEDECAREYLSPWNNELRSFVGQKSIMEDARARQRKQVRAALREFTRDMPAAEHNQSSSADIDEALERL